MPGKLHLQSVLNQPYDRVTFVREILSSIFGGRLTAYSPAMAQTNFTVTEQKLIQSVDHYADLTLDDGSNLRCFEIRLQPQIRIEQSRVGIQQYVRKLLTAGQAVLVNFIATLANGQPDPAQPWRLTLVAKDTALIEGEIKDRPTHAKRYTYLLGPGQACRTAAERLVKLYEQTRLDFASLVQTFEVEALSKTFFKEYKRHYEAVNTYLNGSAFRASIFNNDEKAIRDWSKKLLGRVVFLYFVQKKGWLGASSTTYQDGNTRYTVNFLTDMFHQAGANDAFYPTWLSTLFFETLNCPRPNDDFTMPDGSHVKVPFLNGGLFDRDVPDHNDPIPLPARLFHNEQNPDDPALRGFLDFLNSYNFTVHEDSPDDHYVAVDPEMLGNIFENLLEDNKDKGAFYTPKAIVHYMCQESLIEYLHAALKVPKHRADLADFVNTKLANAFVLANATAINSLLDSVKICDPAIGSGAFPMGLLQEIYQCKLALPGNTNHAEIKLNIIQNSIYGVDIERGAVDIARLRFWLSLVVDEERPRSLPNLDYKIVVGNSLVSKLDNEILTLDWTLRGNIGAEQEIVNLTKQLGQKQRAFFTASDDKATAQRDIRDLKIDLLLAQINLDRAKLLAKMPATSLFGVSAKDQKLHMTLQQQLQGVDDTIRKLKTLRQDPTKSLPYFDWRLDFPEVLNPHVTENIGFDIVVGNPPYVQIQKLDEPTKAALENQKYETYTRMGDLYQLFYELGLNVLVPGGHLCFITSNKWMKAGYGQTLRKYLADKHNPLQLLDFGGVQVFDATVDTNILLVEKAPYSGKTQSVVFSRELKQMGNISDFVKQYSQSVPLSNPDAGWAILSSAETRIRRKIEEMGKPLKEWDIQINYGIKTGFNDAFIVDGATKDELIRLDPKSAEIIRPILKGRDIKPFYAEFSDRWVIFTRRGIDITTYPAIHEYLFAFKKRLEPKPDEFLGSWTGRKGGKYKWYEIQDSVDYWRSFDQEKIVWLEISDVPKFCFDDKKFFIEATAFFLVGHHLHYLLCILNSKLSQWYLDKITASTGAGTNRWKKVYLEKIPVPEISYSENLQFKELAQQIIATSSRGCSITHLEAEVNYLIFKKYGLTDEEQFYLLK
ncbi:Eco57I restriction-modification methylase domain-containing protein [Spirosoma gilvum]